MNFYDLVNKRRSVRLFSSKIVSDEIILKCLESARLAPSACNKQPWHFFVIKNEKLKEKLVNKAFSGIYSNNNFVKTAPVLIAIAKKNCFSPVKIAGIIRKIDLSLIDIGIAAEHLVLQAQEEGLGSCFLGWFNQKEVKKILKIPGSFQVILIVALGWPAEENFSKKIRKPLEEIASFL